MLGGTEKRVDAQWIRSKNPMKHSRKEKMAERIKTVEEIRERKMKAEEEKIQKWEEIREANKQKRLAVRKKSKEKVETLRLRKKNKQAKKVKENKKNASNTNKPPIKTTQIEKSAEPSQNKSEQVIDLKAEDVETVKKTLTKFLDEGRDEFGLETLQMRLLQDGFETLSQNKDSLTNCLKYLDTTTFVFYDIATEVIWII